jgi:hypothetical protein
MLVGDDSNDPVKRWVVSTVRIELVRDSIAVVCSSADVAVEIALRTDPRYSEESPFKDKNTQEVDRQVVAFAVEEVKLKMVSVNDEVSQ